ncbi:MAG: aminotransferase class V-fold PLP-dependent enzyme [Candidatus Aminicenantes bacterium]|nr:aminotransferase class V-fold PLP-dependent enzyme [Candidatus Aminicenantes bacterium]NIM78511.1 aminotransferase class V-fold PLP-dependent enzyme [Candidatus Aminicenantes bacterium]NIN17747.1 aminotransferase class V-fold PLP-dependent enzyme [Candidatus Aminicenantes bacterium]NIN41648.1 aminotransferase class V-fold PLP-dependent enzyme [Candidatus Aminicenantes bacterium]NIN84397.1 aminotransferase class V-fold PLP-dependent enzyme [Candidatus Aminicenantes bacterium]
MNRLPELIFDKSKDGKIGYSFSGTEFSDDLIALDPEQRRTDIEDFPQLSEVEIVRHYTNLSHLNHSVDSGFYPLGSCTMKYNPKINERIAELQEFSAHPYSPLKLVQGNLEVMKTLEEWLIKITGMAGFTLAPAAGAHGEFVGMKIIRKHLAGLGNPRKFVLIPDSAHGTNPASAHFSGYRVKEIPSNADGIIAVETLEEHLDEDVAALMMTNPNTLGIFEKNIVEIAEVLHKNGSLLYMDGANMNAFMGIVKPGDLGVDVIHLNLHKTFSTPHGGGGPGSGPIGVAKHLVKHLPVPVISKRGDQYHASYFNEGIGRVKNFYGNFLVLVRALAYLMALGKENLRKVAEDSVLNANYIRKHLEDYLHLAYPSKTLHEVVFSDKGLDVKTLDIAKRLLDFGIHPFTVYFPLIVHGAMMIEPTETESKESLDEFINAMKAILKEAEEDPEKLTRAPHTTPVRRLDEVQAARQLVLKWQRKQIR